MKSDDVTGRTKTYEAIVKGQNIPTPGIPESFKVLVKELQSLALDVKVLDAEGNEVQLSDIIEEDNSRTPTTIDEIDAAVDREMAEGEEADDMDDEDYDDEDVDEDEDAEDDFDDAMFYEEDGKSEFGSDDDDL